MTLSTTWEPASRRLCNSLVRSGCCYEALPARPLIFCAHRHAFLRFAADEGGDSDEYETDTDEEEERMDVIAEAEEDEEEEEEEEEDEQPLVRAQRPPPPAPKPKKEKAPKKDKKLKKEKKQVVADSAPWSMEVAPVADEIRADLQEMRLRPLKKRALAAGVTYEQLDEAEDEDDYKGAIVELIVARETALSGSGGKGPGGAAAAMGVDPDEIRAELQELKLKELKRRAVGAGVSSDELEDAEDEDDYKAAIVELVVAREVAAAAESASASASGRGLMPGAPSAVEEEASSASQKAAEKLYDRARTLRRQGSYDVAILAYTDAISADHPDLAKCLNERGMCHGQLEQQEEAYEDYVAAIDLLEDPDATGAAVYYYNRGNAALQQGKVAECIRDLKKALQLQPGFAQAASALEELEAAVAAEAAVAEVAAAEEQRARYQQRGATAREPEPEPEQLPNAAASSQQAAVDAAIAEALAKQQREMDATKQQLEAAHAKLREEEEYHRELSQAEKEAHAEALREAEERAEADEVMNRLAAEKAERKRSREQKREELAERERIDAAVAKQRAAVNGAPPPPAGRKQGSSGKKGGGGGGGHSADMGNALEAEIQRLHGERSRRESERKEERARREEDHRLRAEKKSRRNSSRSGKRSGGKGGRGGDDDDADDDDDDAFGRDYKEKERQAVLAVKAAMTEKLAEQEAAESAFFSFWLRCHASLAVG